MRNIYLNGSYFSNNPTWDIEDSPWKAGQIIKILRRNALNPSSICEVGCGAGEILNQLHSRLPQKTSFSGYEISPQAFSICHPKSKDNLTFHLEDIIKSETPHFDVVMAIDVIEHVENYLDFLRKLKPKGDYKIFHIPLDLSILSLIRNTPLLKLRKNVGHIHYFTKNLALTALEDTGYTVKDYFYTLGSVDLPRNGFKQNLLKFCRKFFYVINQDAAATVLGGASLMILAE